MTRWTQKDIDWLDYKMLSEAQNGQHREFVNELDADSAKKDAYRTVRLLQSASRLEMLQQKLTMLKEHDSTLVSKPKRHWMLRAAAAASIFLVIGAALWFVAGPGEVDSTAVNFPDYAENFQHDFIMHDTDHGAEVLSIDIKKRNRAYNLFANEEFNAAIPHLEELWLIDKDELALFYLISSYYFIGKEEMARNLYEENALSLGQKQVDVLEKKLFK